MDRPILKRKPSVLKIDLKSTNGLYMQTVNPCNDFLIDFLIASKLKSEKQGIGKFTTYNLAIESVRKYPLPILCEAQLAALEGFGDFFINQAAKRIQKHYKRGRLPTQQEIYEDDREHFTALQNNRRKGYKRRKEEQNDQQEVQQVQEQVQAQQAEENKLKRQQIDDNSQSKNPHQSVSQKSKKSSRIESYKPRPESEAWKILKALYILNAKNKPVAKGKINQVFFIWNQNSVKSWQFCRNKLLQTNYIEFDKKQQDLQTLTQKGQKFMLQELGQDAHKQKQLILNKLQEDSNKVFKVDSQGRLKLVSLDQNQEVKILVSQEFMGKGSERGVVKAVLGEMGCHRLQFRRMALGVGVGGFMWEIYGKVLDFVVIRYVDVSENFNRDNLAINCNLARIGQWSHIAIVIQSQNSSDDDKLNDNFTQKMQKMKSTLFDCRAAGYKIIQVQNFQQTLIYISQITNILRQNIKNIRKNDGINVLNSLEVLNKKIMQSKMQARLYSKCLRLLPGMNKTAADKMTLKFGTFKMTEHKLKMKFQNMEQRKKFLKHLLADCEIQDENIDKILAFFYSQSYQ